MKILAVDGRFGGASHDSHVWSLSAEKDYLKTQHINDDSGYPLQPWLFTPYRLASENSTEAKFNELLSTARKQRTFGVLKGRFRCLLAARELYYSPKKAAQFLNSCCSLHNICLMFKVDLPTIEEVPNGDFLRSGEDCSYSGEYEMNNLAIRIRNQIKDSLT